MKTKKQIQEEINDLIKEEKKYGDRERKRVEKKLTILKKLVLIFDNNITEDNLTKQLSEQKRKLKIVDDGYFQWVKNTPEANNVKNPKSMYRSLMKRKDIVNHISNIKYLLS